MQISFRLASVFFAMVIACANAYGGIYIESVTVDKSSTPQNFTQRMYVQDGMARIESSKDAVVTLFKGETFYLLNPARKTYITMDAATLERTMSTISEVMKKMQANLASMPPEQRAAMEKMMQQNGMPGAGTKPVVFDAIPLSTTERAAGHTCKDWDITRDGARSAQVCIVPYADLPGKDDIQALTKKMTALLAKLPENLRSQYSGNPLQHENALSAKLNGVPFITRSYRNGTLASAETTVKKWQQQAIAANQFEIPAGYVKQEMPTLNPPAK